MFIFGKCIPIFKRYALLIVSEKLTSETYFSFVFGVMLFRLDNLPIEFALQLVLKWFAVESDPGLVVELAVSIKPVLPRESSDFSSLLSLLSCLSVRRSVEINFFLRIHLDNGQSRVLHAIDGAE